MYQNYLQSEKLYTDETNIVNIINSIRQLKVVMNMILTQNQLKIIEFANYKNIDLNCGEDKSIAQYIMNMNPKNRFGRLCHHLNLKNKEFDNI